jgi:hypothetical protein
MRRQRWPIAALPAQRVQPAQRVRRVIKAILAGLARQALSAQRVQRARQALPVPPDLRVQKATPPTEAASAHLADKAERLEVEADRGYALGRFSVFEARKPCVVASVSHM